MREAVRRAGRATVYLAASAGLTFGSYLFITVLLCTVIATVAVVGVAMLPETVLLMRRWAGAKRTWAGAWRGERIPEAYLPLTGPLRRRLRHAVHDPGTYADLRWMVAQYLYGWLVCLALPLWPVGLAVDGVWSGLLGRQPFVLPLIGRLADRDAAWSARLLRPTPKALLTERVEKLTVTRADALSAHDAELRRIERDLHDGTQARLVALSMRLGLARRAYDADPATARRLLDDAQDQAEEALAELRHVVRGIHPPILTDRGLAGALRALAAGSGLSVGITTDATDNAPRAPAAVEAAAYFVVAEALTNAAKHSGAEHAEVRLAHTRDGLRVIIRDEGCGGAEESPSTSVPLVGGSGLLGMRRRVAALDGTMTVTSPVGGPTVIDVELPCVW
ncbi:histidine kinase [Frankia sp. Cpl3]|nr:histidine kinase [Frankia sp. Cpl3]